MEHTKKVGFFGLAAIVLGSMIGGGVFNLPSNMAHGAALGSVTIAWIITGFGMYFLAQTFKGLSDTRPDLSSGIYSYAAEGFGKYVGFNSAWGYWLSASIGNVSFAILLIQAFGYFFPVFLSGNNWQSILVGSIFIWIMNMIVRRGVKGAAILNAISTVAKLAPLFLFIILLLFAFHWDKMSFDIWGKQGVELGDVANQVKSTMLVTLWVFVGIEGAVVISGRAKNKRDVGKATLVGFVFAVLIYSAISIFSFGIMNQADLAKLPDPSASYVMEAIVGHWGAIVLNVGVIVSVLGAWIAWTIITAEVPSTAARLGVFPKRFTMLNKRESPVFALTMTSIIMQIAILLSALEKNAFLAVISISGSMILVPYTLSSMFLVKLTWTRGAPDTRIKLALLINGLIASLYAFWLIYAAGLRYIFLSSILYAIGIIVYWITWKEQKKIGPLFNWKEKIIAIAIVILAVISIIRLIFGV